MLPVRAHTYISAPREDIFDFIADLANRPAWTDHFATQFRLDHPKSHGVGASARYRLEAPRYRQWVETDVVDAERPRALVEATRAGRLGRTRGEILWELSREGRDLTRVDLTIWSKPGTPREAVMERLGARPWLRRRAKRALERLRTIFEEHPERPIARATVAAWEPLKAPRFGTGVREVSG
ncbi:MAG: SRPBCC family protein [Actinobacteria bacterium]|nr:SRPBCC family protein [Actinomycetota bacterium]